MNYKLLNNIRKILLLIFLVATYPIRIIIAPLYFLMGFFMINWENEWDREFFIKTFKDYWKIKI